MKAVLKKHLEKILAGFAVLSVGLLIYNVEASQSLALIAIVLLSFYYLISGAIVFFNKKLKYSIRILYFTGLWSISIAMVAVIGKLLFWYISLMFFFFALAFSFSVLLYVLALIGTTSRDKRASLRAAYSPLFTRLLIYPAIFFLIFQIPNEWLYSRYGEHRDDEQYKELFLDMLDNPDDVDKQKALEEYEESLPNDN